MTVGQVRCEVYSRIVGYLRPVQNWNKGKQQEWKDRKTYSINRTGERIARGATGMGSGCGTDQATANEWAANDPQAWAEVEGR